MNNNISDSRGNASRAEIPQNITITPEQFIDKLTAVFEVGGTFPLTVTGSSMIPFLAPSRDAVILSKPSGSTAPKRGEIKLFRRDSGDYILHRIYKVTAEGLYFTGDAQTVVEGPIPAASVCADVFAVRRQGRLLTRKNFTWLVYSGLWLYLRPARPCIMKIYSRVKNIFKHKQNGDAV